jgi:hypothetical protein
MKPDETVRNRFDYAKDLVESGVSGLRSGRDSHLNGQPLSTVLSQSARRSLAMALIGASAGLLELSSKNRRNRAAKAVALAVVGSAIGFLAGLAWQTRGLTGNMLRSASKQVGAVRDEQWLERNPIDYA